MTTMQDALNRAGVTPATFQPTSEVARMTYSNSGVSIRLPDQYRSQFLKYGGKLIIAAKGMVRVDVSPVNLGDRAIRPSEERDNTFRLLFPLRRVQYEGSDKGVLDLLDAKNIVLDRLGSMFNIIECRMQVFKHNNTYSFMVELPSEDVRHYRPVSFPNRKRKPKEQPAVNMAPLDLVVPSTSSKITTEVLRAAIRTVNQYLGENGTATVRINPDDPDGRTIHIRHLIEEIIE